MNALDEIRRIAAESVGETLAAYDIASAPRETARVPGREVHLVVATIGFANEVVHGGIVLAMEWAAVDHVRPPGLEGDEDVIAQEVLGAFVNMIAGRMKNRLIPRALIVHLGTPTTASGRNMRLASDPTLSTWHEFAVGPAEVIASVRVDVRADGPIELLDEPSPDAESIQLEGEITLF